MLEEKFLYRDGMDELIAWKEKIDRKPLLIYGMMGTGKTTLAKEFATKKYKKFLYFDAADKKSSLSFQEPLRRETFDSLMEKYIDIEESKEDFFLIFDNLNEQKTGVNSLDEIVRFLSEELRDYDLCMISSLDVRRCLEKKRFGSIEELKLYPLNLKEFMLSNGAGELAQAVVRQAEIPIDAGQQKKMKQYLAVYFITGGFPQVLNTYMETKSIEAVEKKKKEVWKKILDRIWMEPDEKLRKKIARLYQNIGVYEEEQKEGFPYAKLGFLASKKKYEDALNWLLERNLIISVQAETENMGTAWEQLYLPDVGLLSLDRSIGFADLVIQENFLEREGGLGNLFIVENLKYTSTYREVYYTGEREHLFVIKDGGKAMDILPEYRKKEGRAEPSGRKNMKIAVTKDEMKFEEEREELYIPIYALWNL